LQKCGQQAESFLKGIYNLGKDFNMDKRVRGYSRITIGLSIAVAIVGMFTLVFSNSTYETIRALATLIVGPATIWFVYACAYPTFKG